MEGHEDHEQLTSEPSLEGGLMEQTHAERPEEPHEDITQELSQVDPPTAQEILANGVPTDQRSDSPIVIDHSDPEAQGVAIPDTLEKSRPDDVRFVWANGSVYKGADFHVKSVRGNGEFVYHNGDRYIGEWRCGVRQGAGKYVAIDGSEFEGNFAGGMPVKKGKYIDKSGVMYDGQYNTQSEPHGMGTLMWADGSVLEGEFKEGVPDGHCKYTSRKGTYEGAVRGGRKEGRGIFKYANGDIYDGWWKYDKRHGEGSYKTVHPPTFYKGMWEKGKMHGKGNFTDPASNTYTGEFTDGQITGEGTMEYKSGHRYSGQFRNGLRCGEGKMVYPNGDRYTGGWYDDLWHGSGIVGRRDGRSLASEFSFAAIDGSIKYTSEHGEVFKGNVDARGMRQGHGLLKDSNGNTYLGEFKDNIRQGQGSCQFRTANTYDGQWNDGQMEGQGTMNYKNGREYSGQFANNKRSGDGILKLRNGDMYKGGFENNMRTGSGTYEYTNGDFFQGEYLANRRYVGSYLEKRTGHVEIIDYSDSIAGWGKDMDVTRVSKTVKDHPAKILSNEEARELS